MNYTEDISTLFISLFTTVFLLLALSCFFFILFKKIKQLKQAITKKKYWIKIQTHLAQILVQSMMKDADWDFKKSIEVLEISIKKSNLIKQWLLDEMIAQQANVSGDAHDAIMLIYHELDYKAFSLRKLKSKNWVKVASGIRELEQMRQYDCHSQFQKFLNASNEDLRKVARMGLTTLAPDPLSYFDYLQEELTEWERMNIAIALNRRTIDRVPDFSKYYNHSQPTVVMFCVQMSVEFGCNEHISALINLLENPNRELRKIVLDGLTKMGAFQAYDKVNKLILSQNNVDSEVIISALNFIAEMGSEKDKPFLNRMLNHEDMEVRMQAVNAAIKLGLHIKDLTHEIAQMKLHFLNKNIA